jgi:hypothetical protein
VAGFIKHAASSTSGYSHKPEKISGATSALNTPPSTPPTERKK